MINSQDHKYSDSSETSKQNVISNTPSDTSLLSKLPLEEELLFSNNNSDLDLLKMLREDDYDFVNFDSDEHEIDDKSSKSSSSLKEQSSLELQCPAKYLLNY